MAELSDSERCVSEAELRELRNLVGQAHATLALMFGTQDSRRAMASLTQAQTIISRHLESTRS